MIEERFTEEERQRLKSIMLDWLATENYQFQDVRIFSLLSGVDTVLISRRHFPAKQRPPEETPG
jgi:hypothetical protein